ncbi:hypothetical protein V6Z11_D12G021700 [Gossypium hirsutum]
MSDPPISSRACFPSPPSTPADDLGHDALFCHLKTRRKRTKNEEIKKENQKRERGGSQKNQKKQQRKIEKKGSKTQGKQQLHRAPPSPPQRQHRHYRPNTIKQGYKQRKNEKAITNKKNTATKRKRREEGEEEVQHRGRHPSGSKA